MAKRKKERLPRLTLLAYSRRDLLAFVEAAESLRHNVVDLTDQVNQLKALITAKLPGKIKSAAAPAAPGAGDNTEKTPVTPKQGVK